MFCLSAQVFHTRASPRIDGSNRSLAEDYIRVMLDQTNMAETLRYIDELAMAELQMVAAQTYTIATQTHTIAAQTHAIAVQTRVIVTDAHVIARDGDAL